MAQFSMCRLCLSTEDLVVDLYKDAGDKSLHLKITSCMDIKMHPGDGLPSIICKACERNIKLFYEFKVKCLEVDSKLRAMNESSMLCNTENISNIQTNVNINCEFINDKIKDEKFDNWIFYDEPDIDDTETKLTADKETAEFDNYIFYDEPNIDDKETKLTADKEAAEFEGINYLGKVGFDNNNKFIKIENKKCVTDTFQCEICGFVLNTKTAFHRHLRSHNSTKRFSCDLCPKKFTRAAQKVIHIRSHMGIRPYVCDVCGQSATKKQDLIRHMTIHSNTRNYSCTRCDRRFKRSYDVHSHMRSHTGARPYRCTICSREYTSHSSLRKHEKKYCKNKDKN